MFFCQRLFFSVQQYFKNSYFVIVVLLSLIVAAGSFPHSAYAFIGGNRTLTFYHEHTKESLTVTFRRGGSYDQSAIKQLNWFMRDWRRNEQTRMDPALFDLLWEVQQKVGSRSAIHVLSPYRAPATNSALRQRSRRVAKASQHILGKALDFYMPGVSSEKIRMVAVKMQRGGVGFYPHSKSRFIHLDVGSVRAWPRLSESQLLALFPDGKTVHIPGSGKPLKGYDIARAEILSRGGKVLGESYASYAGNSTSSTQQTKSLWGSLFGGDEDEDTNDIVSPSVNYAQNSRSNASFFLEEERRRKQQNVVASAPSNQVTFGITEGESPPADAFDFSGSLPLPPHRTMAFMELPTTSSEEAQIDNTGLVASGLNVLDIDTVPVPPKHPGWVVASSEAPSQIGFSNADFGIVPPPPPTRPAALAFAALPSQPVLPQEVSPPSRDSENPNIKVDKKEWHKEASLNASSTDIPENQIGTVSKSVVSNANAQTQTAALKKTLTPPSDIEIGNYDSELEVKSRQRATAQFSEHGKTSAYLAYLPMGFKGIPSKIPSYRAARLLSNKPLFYSKAIK